MKYNIADLPKHILRKSARARYLRLRITSAGLLEVVVPQRVSRKDAADFLFENRCWVDRHQHLLQSEDVNDSFPDTLKLLAIDAEWSLQFNYSAKRNRLQESHDYLHIHLSQPLISSASVVIQRWLKARADLELTPWLQRVSQQCGLPFQSVTYRGQKTRWGSATRDGRICLNYKLLFLPSTYVEYVMVHELCHTIHFNHSAKFWQLVERFIMDWRILRREVRRADHWVPQWLR